MKAPPRTQTPRRAFHALNAANFLVLTATGLLIQFPDWRASLIGGYGTLLSSAHRWCSVAFGVLPLVLLLWLGPWFWRDAWKRASRRSGRAIRRGNLLVAVVGGAALTLSGAILWWDPPAAPRALFDVSLFIHRVLTYVGLAVLVAHLIWIRRLIWARLRSAMTWSPASGRKAAAPAVMEGTTAGGDPC